MLRLSIPLAQQPGLHQPNFVAFAGRAYRGLGQYDNARRLALQGLRLDQSPEQRSELFDQLAEIYAVMDSTDQSLAYARMSVDIDPNDVIKWNNCGHAHMQAAQYEEAVAIFTTASTRFPPHPYILNNRAEAYIHLGQLDAADADLRASHALDPQNPYLYKNKALYHQRLEEPTLACRYARRAATLFDGTLGYAYDKSALQALYEQCDLPVD